MDADTRALLEHEKRALDQDITATAKEYVVANKIVESLERELAEVRARRSRLDDMGRTMTARLMEIEKRLREK